MRDGFRQAMSWLHTWVGVLAGWVLFFMFLTGALGFVNAEIDRWMKPEAPLHTPVPPVIDMLTMAHQRLLAVAPDAESWAIRFPRRGASGDNWSNVLSIRWPDGHELLDLRAGQPLVQSGDPVIRDTAGSRTLYRMHYRLHYLGYSVAVWIAGICAMLMFVGCVTGVIVHKKLFADFFTFRSGKGQRSWLDLHNLLAVTALPFHLMITYSGLVFLAYVYVSPLIAATYGPEAEERDSFRVQMLDWSLARRADPWPEVAPAGVAAPLTPPAPLLAEAARHWGERPIVSARIQYPGDANARVYLHAESDSSVSRQSRGMMFDGVSGALLQYDAGPQRAASKLVVDISVSLHEGLFAGPALRWLYFLSSMAGTAMIASGLVLWVVKRRQQAVRKGVSLPTGVLLVERFNVGVIIGLPIAIAAFFWANRLLPLDLPGRAAWEIHSMFLVWALLLLHAAVRSPALSWREQCWAATAAYLLLPMVNVFTTDRHLGVSLPHGDLALASVDLTMLALGLSFAAAAWRLGGAGRSTSGANRLMPSRVEGNGPLPLGVDQRHQH